jgi:hypothetical protein
VTLGHAALVKGKQAHDKTGGAKAALRAVAGHHGLLRRVQAAIKRSQVFHGPQCQAVYRMRHLDAAVDRLGVQLARSQLAHHHGAGAAVAFAAALFGAGAMQVFAQHFQQGARGRDRFKRVDGATFEKSNRLADKRLVICLCVHQTRPMCLKMVQG